MGQVQLSVGLVKKREKKKSFIAPHSHIFMCDYHLSCHLSLRRRGENYSADKYTLRNDGLVFPKFGELSEHLQIPEVNLTQNRSSLKKNMSKYTIIKLIKTKIIKNLERG